jgi:hypothetical protein
MKGFVVHNCWAIQVDKLEPVIINVIKSLELIIGSNRFVTRGVGTKCLCLSTESRCVKLAWAILSFSERVSKGVHDEPGEWSGVTFWFTCSGVSPHSSDDDEAADDEAVDEAVDEALDTTGTGTGEMSDEQLQEEEAIVFSDEI